MGAAKCPNKSHSDYKRLVSLVKDDDMALYIYDMLGERIPSSKELDLLEKGGSLTAFHNQRVWDVNTAEGLVDNTKWRTINGFPRPDNIGFFKKKAEDKIEELKRKYYKDGIGFNLSIPAENTGKYFIQPVDKRFISDSNESSRIHIINNDIRADEAAEEDARTTETESQPFNSFTADKPAETLMYNKKQVIDELVSGQEEDMKDELRKYLTGLAADEFNAYTNQAGYNSLGKYWVVSNVYSPQSRNLTKAGITVESENRAEAEEKIAVFKKVIPRQVNVVWDETMGVIAQVEPAGKETGITIRVNPKMLQKDSMGHEFGHILIDLLGGMSNSMIRMGREQLKGTKIEAAVISKYPELVARNDERIDKEILTTAVGIKAAEIWADKDIQNSWNRWLVRFFRRLRAMLGIESSVVLDLASKLVSGDSLKTKEHATTEEVTMGMFIQGNTSYYAQASKRLNGTLSLVDKLIVDEEKFQAKAALALQKKLDILAKRGTNTEEYKKLEDTVAKIQSNNPTRSLLHMIRFAVESTKEMNDKYLAYMYAERHPSKKGTTGKDVLNAKLLSEWRTSVAAWDMLEDLKGLYTDIRDQIDSFGEDLDRKALLRLFAENKALLQITLGQDKFNELAKRKDVNILDMMIEMVDQAISVKKKVQELYISKGKELMVDFLLPYVSHVKVIMRDKYEVEWLNLTPAQQAETPKLKYIETKIVENQEAIEAETKDLIMRELGKAESDVSFLTRYVDTILDSRDVISSALARVVFETQEQSNRQILEWKYKFMDKLAPLEKFLNRTPGMPDEEFWDWILDVDANTKMPTQTIISYLPYELRKDYDEYKDMVWKDIIRKSDNTKYDPGEKGRLIRKWLEARAPRDRELWIKAQIDEVARLRSEGLVSETEEKRFLRNVRVKMHSSKQPLHVIFKTPEAVDAMDGFYNRSVWLYRKPSGYYDKINTKWKAFEAMRAAGLKGDVQTDPRVLFYDFLIETIDQAAVRLPGKYALTTELPSMRKGLGQRYRSTAKFGLSKTDFLKQEISAKFQKQSTDTDRGMITDLDATNKEPGTVERTESVNEAGEPVYFLPIYYTQNKSKDKGSWLPVAEQNFDVASLYFNYLKMSVDFANKHKILAELEMTNYFIQNRDVMKRDGKNNVIIDATAKKIPMIKELRDKALNEKNSNIAGQVEAFMKSIVYGMEKDEEPDISLFGYQIDRAKLLDSLNSFTAINLLGANFVAGFANLNLGELTQLGESFAGQYVTTKDLKDATGYYYKNLGGILKDIGARRPTNIVRLLNDRFDTLNEEDDGRINLSSKFANLVNTNTVFFTSHAGEHYMQTRFMLAMLKHMRALDKEGNDMGDMLSNISVDEETGTLKIADGVANFTEKDQTAFSAKLHRVLSSMHGEYTKMGQSAIERIAIGRMTILFRRFIVPGFKRRWQKGKVDGMTYSGVNNLLEESTEGTYITLSRVAKNFFKDMLAFKREAMASNGRKLTTLERANMNRVMFDMATFALLIVMSALVLRAKDADDDDNDWVLNHVAYQLLRLRSEMMFWSNPQATMTILRSPMASLSLFENTFKLIGQLFYPIYSGSLFTGTEGFLGLEIYEQGSWKDHLKIEKSISNLLPVYKQYHKLRDIQDQLSWFNQ